MSFTCQRAYFRPGYCDEGPCPCAHCRMVKEGRKAWNPETRKWELTRQEDRDAVEKVRREYYESLHRLDEEIAALRALREKEQSGTT